MHVYIGALKEYLELKELLPLWTEGAGRLKKKSG